MKFLLEAHLPRRLARQISEAGYDVLHTLDLPNGNRTSDVEINTISIAKQRVIVTKDSDFVNSFVLYKQPWKLLLVSTGNISNRELEQLFAANLPAISNGFMNFDFIEISRTNVIFHL
jgi:predicted nuclease of predicted toxin-antitoxin system